MVSMYKLNNLKQCLEGHNATIETIGKPYVSRKAELKATGKARQDWAEKTQQSWVKRKEGKQTVHRVSDR